MIRQIVKMLWKRRKSNFLLIFQLFVSFLAMSLFIALNIEKFTNYFRPYSYNYSSVWGISLNLDGMPKETAGEYLGMIRQKLKALPETELVSNTTLIPFQSPGYDVKATVNNNKLSFRTFMADENLARVLRLPILKGRWFKKEDRVSAIVPVVITRDLSDEYFKGTDPIGKTIMLGDKPARILGVSAEYRDHFTGNIGMTGKGCIFKPIPADTSATEFLVRSTHTNDFFLMEEKVRKELSSIKDENFTVRTSAPVTMLKKISMKTDLIQLTVALLIFGFLLLNIFLGISGVFSYAITKRKPEIGLRVAAGASSAAILRQFIAETMVLTSFAVVPGTFVALQFLIAGYFGNLGLVNGLSGIAGSAIFIYLLMMACSLYPSLKASRIQPADALHEE